MSEVIAVTVGLDDVGVFVVEVGYFGGVRALDAWCGGVVEEEGVGVAADDEVDAAGAIKRGLSIP